MTQRNPMNERNQNDDRKGHTRKSAASAKPKASAASTVKIDSGAKTPREKKMERKQKEREAQAKDRELQAKYLNPDTPEYYKWKRIWWIGLGAAVLFVLASWLLRSVEPEWMSLIILGFAYVAIIFAFWVDVSKIKKITRAWREEQAEKERKANKGKSKKQIEAEREAAHAEEVRKSREALEKTAFGRWKLKRIAKREEQEKAKEAKNASAENSSDEESSEENASGLSS